MRRFIPLLLMSTLVACTDPKEQEWAEVGRYSSDSSTFYLHKRMTTFTEEPDYLVVTARFEFSFIQRTAGEMPYQSSIMRLAFDCAHDQAFIIERMHFAGRNGEGKRIQVQLIAPADAKRALAPIKDPAVAALLKIACRETRAKRSNMSFQQTAYGSR